MSDLAERIRAVRHKYVNSVNPAEAKSDALAILVVNAPTLLAGLAAIEERDKLREAIAPVVAEINNRWADVHDESWSADYHCEFEMTVAECRTLLLAVAALADTAERAKP